MPTPRIYIAVASLLEGRRMWLLALALCGLVGLFVSGLLARSAGPGAQQIPRRAVPVCFLAVLRPRLIWDSGGE